MTGERREREATEERGERQERGRKDRGERGERKENYQQMFSKDRISTSRDGSDQQSTERVSRHASVLHCSS